MTDTKQIVRSFILENFLMGGDRVGLRDQDSLLDQRVLDSTGFIELVTYLEQTFGVRIEDHEMVPENLDSLDNIEAFLSRKRARRA
jgi:acyl carrier protein